MIYVQIEYALKEFKKLNHRHYFRLFNSQGLISSPDGSFYLSTSINEQLYPSLYIKREQRTINRGGM